MKASKMKIFFCVAVIVVLAWIVWPVDEGKDCFQTSDNEVIEAVKKDFLQRMNRWESDEKELGTKTPKMEWGRIERSNSNPQSEEVLVVPFKATGTLASKNYFGMYECKKNSVEYAKK